MDPPRLTRLHIRDRKGHTRVVPLDSDELTVGRHQSAAVHLADEDISRRHARIYRVEQTVFIEDLESFNGVKINGNRISATVEIGAGDQIEIGDYILWLEGDEGTPYFSPPTVRLEPE